MTVASESIYVAYEAGGTANETFEVPFSAYTNNIKVYVDGTLRSTGLKYLDTDGNAVSAGSVVKKIGFSSSAPAAGAIVALTRESDIVQETVLTPGEPFYPSGEYRSGRSMAAE